MCGIAGVVGGAHGSGERDVRLMLARLMHRGPDEEGIGGSSGATLGCRRLAIIDMLHGHQPMRDETGDILAVQNGELYNYRDVREELLRRGHRFGTDSDTEVLPHLYEEYGADFPHYLRGMFAVAVWDGRERMLVLARDRLGKKPLVYAESEGGIAFASEIQALLALGTDRTVDDAAIREYLSFGYVRAPRTAFSAIRCVQPGHARVYVDGRLREERTYWRIAFSPKEPMPEHEAVDRVRAAIAEAVRVRLIGDVPLGAFLSGGLDSSTVVAFMAQESTAVRTYSVGFADEDYSELRYARLVAQRFGTDHHEFVVEPAAASVLPMLVRHLGQPFADASVVPTYYVAKTARQHVTVALNGDGGDELFAGYTRYRAALLAERFRPIPRPVRRLIAAGARRMPEPAWVPSSRRARRFAMTLGMTHHERYRRWTGFFADDLGILGPRLRELPEPTGWLDEAQAEARATDGLDEMLAVDLRAYLPGDLLVKMDIATMAASLEGRSPFLDHELVELMARLPSALKLRGGTSKYLLRRLMRGVLPDEVLDRSKMGFGGPVGRWLRGPLRGLVEDAVLGAPDRGYVEPRRAHQIVDRLYASPTDNGLLVWCLLMLELWFRYVAEAPVTATYTSA